MVRRLVLAAALVGSVAACAAIVDLGPEATLRASDADVGTPDGGDDATADANGAPESGSDSPSGSDAMYACGLPPAPNATCNACDVQNCCDMGIQCAKNARCAEGMAKLLDCVFDTTCVGQVDRDYSDAGVVQYQNCVLGHCVAQCFPKMICSQLAGCCKDIPSDQVAARQTCIGAVNQLDEANCQNILDHVLRPQLGSQFCGGPAPDAGGD